MNIPDSILSLIQIEQIKQGGRFIPQDEKYLEKLDSHAELITHQVQRAVLGYVFFYCNDPNKRFSYITLIGTSQAARGRGVGFGLLQNVLTLSKIRGFHSCQLEVRKENAVALNFYQRAGFLPIEEREDRFLMKKDLL